MAVYNDPDARAQIIRYDRGISKISYLSQKPRDFLPIRIVLVGPTGTGKSTLASLFPKPCHVQPPGKGEQKWFDPYDHFIHETLIIDDYKPGAAYKFSYLLNILDSKPLAVPVKGGHQQLATKYIVVTSNQIPEEWYPILFREKPSEYEALDRRIDIAIRVNTNGNYEFLRGREKFPSDITLPSINSFPMPPPKISWKQETPPYNPVTGNLVQQPIWLTLSKEPLSFSEEEARRYRELRNEKKRTSMLQLLRKVN